MENDTDVVTLLFSKVKLIKLDKYLFVPNIYI